MALETPKYEILQKDGKFEIRQYEGYILAEVEIEADHMYGVTVVCRQTL